MRRWIFAGGGLVAAVVIVAGSWLLLTEGGLRFAFSRLVAAAPVAVSAGALEGRIAGRISVASLRVGADSFQLQIGKTNTELALLPLLAGEVHLRNLFVRDVRIETKTGQPAEQTEGSGSTELPSASLPFRLRIDALHAEEISVLRAAATPLLVRAIEASGLTYSDQHWRLASVRVDSEALQGAGDVSYRGDEKHEVIFNFKGLIQLNDNNIEINSSVEGNEDHLKLEQTFVGALSGRMTGVLDGALSSREWSLTADLDFDDVRQWLPEFPSGHLRTAFTARGSGNRATATGSLALAGQPELLFDTEVAVTAGAVLIEHLDLREAGGAARLDFSGELTVASPYPRVSGKLGWASVSWPLVIDDGQRPMVSSPSGRIEIEGEEGSYQLEGQAVLSDGSATGTFTTAGSLDLRGVRPRFDLGGAWDTIAIQLADGNYVAERGRYSIAGMASGFRFDGGFELRPEGWPAATIEVTGEGDAQRLRFESIVVDSKAGRLQGTARLELADQRPFELQVEGRRIDPGAFASRWPGRLDIAARLTGQLDADGASLQLDVRKLGGLLRGQSLDARGQLSFREDELRVAGVEASWGEATLKANGNLGARVDVSWRLSVPDLAVFTSDGAGRVTTTGRLAGSRLNPVVAAKMEGEGLRLGAYAAEQIHLDANVNFVDQASSTLLATASGVELSGNKIAKLVVQGSGEAGAHRASLRAETDRGIFSSELSGRLDDQRWFGTLAGTRVELKSGDWVQEVPARFAVSETAWSLGKICLAQDPASVCLNAAGIDGSLPVFEVEIQTLPLAELGLLLPEGLEYAGAISGRARIEGTANNARGSATFDIAEGRVWQMIDGEPLLLLDSRSASGKARLSDGSLSLDATLLESDNTTLSVRLGVPFESWALVDGAVTGDLEGTIDNLGFLSILFPDLADVRGRVETRLKLGGTTGAMTWNGYAELLDGQGLLPGLGIIVSQLAVRLEARGDTLLMTGSMRSGQGTLALQGEANFSGAETRGRFQLSGQDFLAADLPEARIVASPSLVLELSGRRLQLQGDVLVSEARLAPRDLSGTIQRSQDEQLMRGDGAPVATREWLPGGRVRIEFGDNVTFDGFGLKARITGSVTAIDQPGRVTTATGEVQIVDGVYAAYGRDLEVRKGRLLFSGGPLANPGLDILALRQIGGGPEVGVIARATLDEPELTLYSNPSLPPAQILSYLLVGQPLADIGGADKQLVSDTAAKLATAGGGLLAQQLGRRFGLGDISVGSGPSGEAASLVIGKYLSPKLYASYGIGLFEPVNTLRLRYLLSSKWNLRAESGLNQSLDLEYTLDR